MLLITVVILALLFGILGSIQKIGIPDPLIQGLFEVANFCIAAFMKRRHACR